mmetsp:Transcript_22299/g.56849  ORF Transcript_22299/g.56849 Transcript_22299/m.56849 type:complete len:293 (+) Transcript_22299:720-1598(+)
MEILIAASSPPTSDSAGRALELHLYPKLPKRTLHPAQVASSGGSQRWRPWWHRQARGTPAEGDWHVAVSFGLHRANTRRPACKNRGSCGSSSSSLVGTITTFTSTSLHPPGLGLENRSLTRDTTTPGCRLNSSAASRSLVMALTPLWLMSSPQQIAQRAASRMRAELTWLAAWRTSSRYGWSVLLQLSTVQLKVLLRSDQGQSVQENLAKFWETHAEDNVSSCSGSMKIFSQTLHNDLIGGFISVPPTRCETSCTTFCNPTTAVAASHTNPSGSGQFSTSAAQSGIPGISSW